MVSLIFMWVLSDNVNLCMFIQENVTKQTIMEMARSEQLREKQDMEKKLQKLSKTMDYLERAKREEAAPLIEAAFQRRLVEEKVLHEREQQVCLHVLCTLVDGVVFISIVCHPSFEFKSLSLSSPFAISSFSFVHISSCAFHLL